jgi:hypothetical protein
MMNNCANPKCAKPLHYLREGRVFVFEVQNRAAVGGDAEMSHHLEHFWLCGQCSLQFQVVHEYDTGVRLVPRRITSMRAAVPDTLEERKKLISSALAS